MMLESSVVVQELEFAINLALSSLLYESNRKAMNRNWDNQKANK